MLETCDERLVHDCHDAYWLIVHTDNLTNDVGPMPDWIVATAIGSELAA